MSELEEWEKEIAIRNTIDILEESLDQIQHKRLKQELKPEFRFLQPVLVRDKDHQEWKEGFYLRHIYGLGGPSFLVLGISGTPVNWKQCIPDPEATTRINWIPWDGEDCPTNKPVIIELKNGVIGATRVPEDYCWGNIIAYAIIEE
jgi:hypothetical protein